MKVIGKHTAEAQKIRQLEDTISRKDKEIRDIKRESAEQFKAIKDLCFINDYGDRNMKLRKIYEIASDNFSALVKDMVITDTPEETHQCKIIELPTTDQSNR